MPSTNNASRDAPTFACMEPLILVGVWLTVEEALVYAGINRNAFYKALHKLDARKLGKRTMVRRASLDKFMAALPKVGPRGQRPIHGIHGQALPPATVQARRRAAAR